jgi:hypothetical protein
MPIKEIPIEQLCRQCGKRKARSEYKGLCRVCWEIDVEKRKSERLLNDYSTYKGKRRKNPTIKKVCALYLTKLYTNKYIGQATGISENYVKQIVHTYIRSKKNE